jgi:hypothetical protein
MEAPDRPTTGAREAFAFRLVWTFRGAGVDFSMHSEFWLSREPSRVTVPIMRLVNKDGVIHLTHRVALESGQLRN